MCGCDGMVSLLLRPTVLAFLAQASSEHDELRAVRRKAADMVALAYLDGLHDAHVAAANGDEIEDCDRQEAVAILRRHAAYELAGDLLTYDRRSSLV